MLDVSYSPFKRPVRGYYYGSDFTTAISSTIGTPTIATNSNIITNDIITNDIRSIEPNVPAEPVPPPLDCKEVYQRIAILEDERVLFDGYREAIKVEKDGLVAKVKTVEGERDRINDEFNSIKNELSICVSAKSVLVSERDKCMGSFDEVKNNMNNEIGNLNNEISNQKAISSKLMDDNYVLKTDNQAMAVKLGQAPPPPEWYEIKSNLAMAGGGIALISCLISWLLLRK